MATTTNSLLSQLAAELSAVAASSGASGASGSSGASGTTGNGFCGTEQKLSDSPCDSLYPAVAMDPSGRAGIAWQDTRDGNLEIYFKTYKSQSQAAAGTVVDPATGRTVNLACSGFSSLMALDDIVAALGATTSNGKTLSGGRLDVNTISRTMNLSGTSDTDFRLLGVTANTEISILNGLNAGVNLFVASILAPNALSVVYFDGPQNDTGFVFKVTNDPASGTSSSDVRLTCDAATSIYPDIVADSKGRFHIAYQDNQTGSYELYYIEVFPACVGQESCAPAITTFTPIIPPPPPPPLVVVLPPTLAPFADVTQPTGSDFVVIATGIGHGSPSDDSLLTLTVVSSDPTLVSVVGVDYSSPGSTGQITLAGLAIGTVTITATVSQASGGSISHSFSVTTTCSPNLPNILNYSIAVTLDWPNNVGPSADLDVYAQDGLGHVSYYGSLSTGGMTLNHDAHPVCNLNPLAPEIITGTFTDPRTFSFYYNQYSTCLLETVPDTRMAVITNNGPVPIKVNGTSIGQGQSFTIAPIAYAGYGTGAVPGFVGGTSIVIENGCV